MPLRHKIRIQLPLDLGQTSEPEPDCTIVLAASRQNLAGHPTSAVLVIEVADSSLAYDRGRKGSLYARAGIQDYWIINLVDDRLEVYRDPIPDSSEVVKKSCTVKSSEVRNYQSAPTAGGEQSCVPCCGRWRTTRRRP